MFTVDAEKEDWIKWIGVDRDTGKAFGFHKRPEMIDGFWIPTKSRIQNRPSCVQVAEDFSDEFAGRLFKRKKKKGEKYWALVSDV